ncbi:MAG: hypothetical protein ABSB40_12065 [Nitrososphaeria archaeon]
MWLISLLKACFQGILECLSSAEGFLALAALLAVTFLCYHKCCGDMAFAAVCTMVPSIFAYCQHKIDLKQLESSLPEKGK